MSYGPIVSQIGEKKAVHFKTFADEMNFEVDNVGEGMEVKITSDEADYQMALLEQALMEAAANKEIDNGHGQRRRQS